MYLVSVSLSAASLFLRMKKGLHLKLGLPDFLNLILHKATLKIVTKTLFYSNFVLVNGYRTNPLPLSINFSCFVSYE